MEDAINNLKTFDWNRQSWKPTPALVDRNGFASHQYLGQSFDPKYLTIDPVGWQHDHCEICQKTFCEDSAECEVEGYNSDNLWLCADCFQKYISV